MEERLQKLEKEIELLKQRNLRVESDKAWEISYFRVFLISGVIYIIAVKLLYFVGVENYFLNALMPALGYFLSVQTLPFVKKWWMNKNAKR